MKFWGWNSIKVKLVVMFVFAGAIPMIISMRLINTHSKEVLLEKISDGLIESVSSREVMLNDHIEALKASAQILADDPSINAFLESIEHDGSVHDAVFKAAGIELGIFQSQLWGKTHHIFITDRTGTVVFNAPKSGWEDGTLDAKGMRSTQRPHFGDSIADAHYFKDALKETTITDFFGFAERDHYHQLVLSPVKDTDGNSIGLVVIEVAIDYMNNLLAENFQVGDTGHLYLATTTGHRVVHFKSNYNPNAIVGTGIQEAVKSHQVVVGWYAPVEQSGPHEVYGAYYASRVNPWVVAVEIDRDEVEAPLIAQQRLFLFVSFIGIGCLTLLVYVIGRKFWRPLRAVVVAAERVADGDVWHEFAVDRKDEIGQLQVAVDSMRVSLKTQIDHLDALIAERTAELEYANGQLKHDAENDKLTGLANRDVLEKALDYALKVFRRNNSHLVSALFFDFDRFKVVNDSLGHATGDALLCSIADRFRKELRDTDLAARFGGDEFVVMLSPVESHGHAKEAAQRLLKVFEEPHIIDGHRIVSTASIGLVIADQRYTSADEMIRDADSAMYEAKLAGKGQVVEFDEGMFEDAKRRLRLEEDLNDAIKNNELRVMYQPIIELEDMSVAGFEALIRWQHPELGMVRPDHFIPIAEDTGQIVEIGAWIMNEACQQVIKWDQELGLDGSISINVNVAKRQLIHPEFLGMVRRVLKSTGLDPKRLKIEITESTAIDPRHDMSVVIDRIRDLGILIAMDDFGTGHSSLSLLHKFDFDILKIDQSFVQGMEQSREMSAVLHSIIALAQNTGMAVVAEGAETSTQVACLISHGCDLIQGYYFSKPLPVERATEMLQTPPSFQNAA